MTSLLKPLYDYVVLNCQCAAFDILTGRVVPYAECFGAPTLRVAKFASIQPGIDIYAGTEDEGFCILMGKSFVPGVLLWANSSLEEAELIAELYLEWRDVR